MPRKRTAPESGSGIDPKTLLAATQPKPKTKTKPKDKKKPVDPPAEDNGVEVTPSAPYRGRGWHMQRDPDTGLIVSPRRLVCRNTACPLMYLGAVKQSHPSGYCYVCCPRFGPLGCRDCEWDDVVGDEDE